METVRMMYQNVRKRAVTGYRYLSSKIKLYHVLYFCVFLEFAWMVSYYLSPTGRAGLNSDLTTGVQFLEQVIKEKALYPKNWIYTNTIGLPVWTPIRVFFYLLTGDYITTTMLGFAFYLFLMGVSVWYFVSRVLKMGKSLTAFLLFLLLSPGTREYFNDVFYCGYSLRVAVFICMTGFGLQCVTDGSFKLNRKYLCLYAGTIFLFVTGDFRYLATVILPLAIASAICYLLENYQADLSEIFTPLKRYLAYLLTIAVIVAVCMAVEIYLKNRYTYVDGYFGASLISDLSELWVHLKRMIQAYLGAFGFVGDVPQMSADAVRSFCALIFVVYIIIVNPVLLLIDYKRLSFVMKQLIVYRWIGYAVLLFFWLFGSGIVFRHAITYMVLDLILTVYYFSVKMFQNSQDRKVIQVFGCVILLFYLAFNWTHVSWPGISKQWTSKAAIEKLEDRERIISQIKARKLTYGYAPYWTASMIAAFSQQEVKIYPWNLYERFQWYAPDQLYLPADQKEATFLLMPEEEYEDYSKMARFQNVWGDYKEKVEVGEHVLLIYDYNIALNFGEFCHLSDHILKNMSIPETNRHQKLKDFSNDGHKAILLEPEEFIYGPYMNLSYGVYDLQVSTTGKAFLNIYALKETDEESEESETINIFQTELTKGDNQISFYLLEDTERVEFYISNNGEEEIAVTEMALKTDTLFHCMNVTKQDARNTADEIWLTQEETLFGPYIKAEQGTYAISVTVSHDTQIHIWAEKSAKKVIQQILTAGKNEFVFELDQDVSDLEFVIQNTDRKDLKISSMQIKRQKPEKTGN